MKKMKKTKKPIETIYLIIFKFINHIYKKKYYYGMEMDKRRTL